MAMFRLKNIVPPVSMSFVGWEQTTVTAFSTMMKDLQARLSSSNLEDREVALMVTLM